MDRNQILEKLQAKNKNLRLPSGMEFSIENKVLTIGMKENGLTANMQTDASAFEGWAICLKAWLPEYISAVKIGGDVLSFPKGEKKTIEERHYNRFLYRLGKFIEIYSWASTTDNFKQEIDEIFKTDLYINVPRQDASKGATHCEAQLERAFREKNESSYCALDHQLPVRIFCSKETKEADAITPGGFIDIWGIKDECLKIFELKLPVNKEIGIISELMFYVNVMTDVINGTIKIPFSSKYRSFDQLFEFQKNKKCKKIEGVFLADNLHSGIKNKLDEVLHIINGGNFSFNTEYLYEKPKTVDTIIKDDSTKRKDMKQEGLYKSMQKKKQLELLQHTDFFENAIGCGIWWNNNQWGHYSHIIQHQDSLKNLYKGIRKGVMSYFKEYDIAWWREDEDRYFPTGNLLSSQIHCLNHLFKLRRDPYAVLSIVQKICPSIVRILPSPIDDHEYFSKDSKNKIKSFISFEFTYNNVDLLKERTCKRGKDCTSIDAFVYAVDKEGNRVLIAIEWKYTEAYKKTDDKKADDSTIDKRYRDLAARKNSNLGGWKELYNWDPQYELARQTLLMEQIVDNKPFKADDYRHIVVCPNDNIEMVAEAEAFKDSLEEKSKFIIIDPQEFLSPISSLKDEKGEKKYADLLEYLETRYWK